MIAEPPDILVAHTGIGFRGWLAAAEGWGLATPADRGVVVGPDRVSRTEGDRRAARRRPARGMVAEVRILTRATAIPTRIRRIAGTARSPCSCTAPPTPGIRSRSLSADCAPRAPTWCPSGCTGGSQHRWAATSTSWSPGIARRQVRRGQLHVGAGRGGGAGTQPRPGHRGPAARSAAHRCARDVRGPGDLPAVDPKGRPDVVARANAVGRLGPAHRRRAAAAGVAHGEGRRPPASTSAEPACWSTVRSSRCRRSGMAIIRALAHRPGDVVVAQRLAAGAARQQQRYRTPSTRRCCGCERPGRQEHCRDGGQARLPAGGRRPAVPRVNLMLVAHGTRRAGGVAMIGDLAARVSDARAAGAGCVRRRVGTHTQRGAVASTDRATIVVPAFLSRGYHVRTDLPAHVAASGHPDVIVTGPRTGAAAWCAVLADQLIESAGAPVIR